MLAARPARRLQVYAAIVLINVAVYLVLVLKGVHWLEPNPGQLIPWGANVAPLTLTGEPWRLLTSMFLHIGLLHLVLNCYMLVIMGPLAERTFGHIRFTLVYLISGLFGSLASALWHANHKVAVTVSVGFGQVFTFERLEVAVAAGASGALMGITGAVLAHLVVAHARHQQHQDINLRGPLFQTIAINLGMGFMIPGIDNACHIGGLVAGMLLGAGLALPGSKPAARAGAGIALVAASCALLYLGLQVAPSADLMALRQQLLGTGGAR
jgi:rhomboid protease GluP